MVLADDEDFAEAMARDELGRQTMDLLHNILGGGQQRQQFQDFANRYDQGAPWDRISEQEALQTYRQVAPYLPPQVWQEAASSSRHTPHALGMLRCKHPQGIQEGRTMAKNVLGLFENVSDADAAVRDLERAGCSGTNVSVIHTASDRLSSSVQKQHGLLAGSQVSMAVWPY